ncbi:MAG: hypothetical protein LBO77_05385 [Desulfovibrio sp.]|jgi:hypothetical protein|nr:hypothetical protein [Desulfovibrio sp.]
MAEPDVRRKARADSPAEKKRREMLLYLGISIAAVELFLAVGGLCFGFIASLGRGPFSFPWLLWGSLSLLVPAVILLAVHLADVGLFAPSGEEAEEWQRRLPERMRRLYLIIRGAPAAVVIAGLIALGVALLTIDGALSAAAALTVHLAPHIPLLIGGLVFVLGVAIAAAAWLHYRSRRLYEEYAYRREVLEKTGVILVDKGSIPLVPDGRSLVPALEAGQALTALAAGGVLDVTAGPEDGRREAQRGDRT